MVMGHVFNKGEQGDSRVVDQHIQRAEITMNILGKGLHVVKAGDVKCTMTADRNACFRDQTAGFIEPFRVNVRYKQSCSPFGHGKGGGPADTAGRTCDKDLCSFSN